MAKSQGYPSFYKALKNKDLYPEATRKIKFLETPTSYFFITGTSYYKIKKEDPYYSSPAVTEAFLHEEMKLGQMYAGAIYQDVLPLAHQDGDYFFGQEGQVVSYALKLQQLNENHFLTALLQRQKVTASLMEQLAKHLAAVHQEHPVVGKGDMGRPENLDDLCKDVIYQAQKYLNQTVTQPMLDLIRRPLEKFGEDQRPLFSRRMKKKRIVQGHGALLPEHIYIKEEDIHFISPQEVNRKFCLLDVANDVAYLTVELMRLKEAPWADLFIKEYVAAAKDKELLTMLPTYQTFVSLKQGVLHSERMAGLENSERNAQGQMASDYFNLAVRFSRTIPKS